MQKARGKDSNTARSYYDSLLWPELVAMVYKSWESQNVRGKSLQFKSCIWSRIHRKKFCGGFLKGKTVGFYMAWLFYAFIFVVISVDILLCFRNTRLGWEQLVSRAP